jgi:hypothetical protein
VIVVASPSSPRIASRPGAAAVAPAAASGPAEIEAARSSGSGSSDVAEREKAAGFLWAAGAAAERALREAAAGDDLETARRAKSSPPEPRVRPHAADDAPTLRDLIVPVPRGGQPGAKQAAVNAHGATGGGGRGACC